MNGLARSAPEHVGKIETVKLQELCRGVYDDHNDKLMSVLAKKLSEAQTREQFCVSKAKLCKTKADLWKDEHFPDNRCVRACVSA